MMVHPAYSPVEDGANAYTRPDTVRAILDRQAADKSRRLDPRPITLGEAMHRVVEDCRSRLKS